MCDTQCASGCAVSGLGKCDGVCYYGYGLSATKTCLGKSIKLISGLHCECFLLQEMTEACLCISFFVKIYEGPLKQSADGLRCPIPGVSGCCFRVRSTATR